MNDSITVKSDIAVVISAALSAYLGQGNFTVKKIVPLLPKRRESTLSKKAKFFSWKTNN